ncbi:dissimilatory nitrite reductase (NO-forming) copper type apoprotein [Pseudoduganella flava]|uniref:Copper-containing nitrite reductase n=1 Tax=Pseudoduganella flava TaxID=871742 RepID=A0A562PBM9_9BURK|nr:copper-containing nitrite reductase [Pseudoduganella flava]QGZ37996.1 nitrite reductase, copper-containing [Pseudoduganella flava]TWI41818.1 dissimilatory nitrite reductase (NO-forming) copper type apoprotein [Pseudoduganella flava]
MNKKITLGALLALAAALPATVPANAVEKLPVIEQELVAPPAVPPRITRKTPAKVVVNLTVEEVEREIAPGTRYMFWTFGGTVPGKMIRVREGDTVELHLKNLNGNKLPHNIDLHAVTGPGGGASQTLIAPGNEAVFTFKALQSGLYVYHCATAPVGMHIANGMYGMILVEPPEGMAAVDHEYYVMQGDFYTEGTYRASGLQKFDMNKAIDEKPTYVLFNGADGALTGKNALTAKTGESVRMFFGVGGPNITSSFHVIGTIFDKVYFEGGKRTQENVQTTMVPAGGSAILEFTPRVPGNLTLVDHSLTRAFNKGAIGLLSVSGKPDPAIYSEGIKRALPGAAPATSAAAAPNPVVATTPAQHVRGKAVYDANCAACHQADGKGVAGVFPPLANSDFFKERPYEMAHIVLNGRSGEIVVNGEHYNGVMPPQDLSDDDIAAVINYVNVEMNKGKPVIEGKHVREMRANRNK